jgi:hypothetical protein
MARCGVSRSAVEPGASGAEVVRRAVAANGEVELLRWTFPPAAGAPGEARRRAAVVLGGSPHVDTALVLVSELVTNAVLHTAARAELRILERGAVLRVEVEDHVARIPASPPTPGAHGGFGLRIVAAMANRWGTEPSEDGKVVWFELGQP